MRTFFAYLIALIPVIFEMLCVRRAPYLIIVLLTFCIFLLTSILHRLDADIKRGRIYWLFLYASAVLSAAISFFVLF